MYRNALAENYMHFFHNDDAAPVMVLESENIHFSDKDDDLQMLVNRVDSMRGHREHLNRGE